MNRARVFWAAICFCFIVALLFAEGAAAGEADHDCTDEDCPVCAMIQDWGDFLRQPKSAVFYSGFQAAVPLAAAFVLRVIFFLFVALSSVRLKVRMNR
jgi:hypothetical protein